jgi:putative protease
MEALDRLGFVSATASFELNLAQVRDLSKELDTELLAYGRLSMMLTENCLIHNRDGVCNCQSPSQLIDRKGLSFPVVNAWGCRSEILNAKTLFLADKQEDYQSLGLWAVRLSFTTETAEECVAILNRYLGRGDASPESLTRGLYYRKVE